MWNHLGVEVIPDDDGWITTTIEIELSEIIGHDLEAFLDLISERATGTEVSLLQQQSWRIMGYKDDTTLILEVRGDASEEIALVP